MYINLILGAVAVVVLWLYLRKLLVRDDALSENPAELLEKELARRRAMEAEAGRAFERMRDMGKERMRPVVAALAELRAAMPSVSSAKSAERMLAWDDEGDTLIVRIRDAGGVEDVANLSVSWRVPEFDLQKTSRYGADLPGVFVLRRSDSGREESVPGLDACVRSITAFIVDFMA